MQKKILYLIATMAIFSACTETVVLDLNKIEHRLVVEASISNDTIPAMVKLSLSQGFYDTISFQNVTTSTVELIDENGNVTTLNHQGEGIFSSLDFQAEFEKQYTLEISFEGEIISAQNIIPAPLHILEVAQFQSPFFGPDSLNPIIIYDDVNSEENFFRLKMDKLGVEPDESFYLLDDTFAKNDTIVFPVYFKNYAYGDTVVFQLYHITKSTFDYFIGLSENMGGSFNSISPGNPINNLPENVMGNFNGYSIHRDTVIMGENVWVF